MADAAPEVGTPDWWLSRLFKQLVARQESLTLFDDYYSGNHPLPWLAPQARDEFRRILRMTRSNYMGLVVDAMVERLAVEGFRLGAADGSADADTWRIWQANGLDSDFDQALLEAAIGSCSYMLVAPNPKDSRTPFVWVEHASQAIVGYTPGSNRRDRAAGLKLWLDDWTGDVHSMLQVGDQILKYQAKAPAGGLTAQTSLLWSEREVAGEQPNGQRKNPLGVVTLVELPNNPRLLTGGVSELADVIDVQDRANKTTADRLITQDYGAFPQKWASAWPEEDAQGNPTPAIDIGRNRMVTTEVEETRFGQWDAAPLDPYSAAKREDVRDIASRTRTPAQYLLGDMSNVNGETLKASESGLVSKIRQRQRSFSDPLEDVIRLARRAAGLPDAGADQLETIWRNPEFRTEGELTDAVVKKLQAGIIPLRQAREDLGYSAEQIKRMAEEDAADPVMLAARSLTDVTTATGPADAAVGGR